MTWPDAVGLALTGMRRRPGRAVLTVLAVALAAALLTALLTIAGTAETRVLDELAKGGPLAGIRVAAAAPDPTQVGRDDARPGQPRDLGEAARQRIAGLPEVRRVLPVVSAPAFVLAPEEAAGVAPEPFAETLVGVDLTQSASLPVTLLAGRLPVPASPVEVAVTQGYLERLDLDRTRAAEVVGSELRLATGRLFVDPDGGRPDVRGRWVRLRVVGVVAQEAGDGQLLGSLEQVRTAREWSLGGADGGPRLAATSDYSGLFVVAQGIDNVSQVRSQITAIGYATSAPENLVASVRRYLRVVEIVLTAVGAIALVVAALGITNALLAAVRERQREIGVLKAIGARDRDVLRVFLVEAGGQGFLGGVIGTVVGWFIARGVGEVVNGYLRDQGLAGVALGIPVVVVVGAVLGSAALALVGGVVPALRAARLPAREAIGGA